MKKILCAVDIPFFFNFIYNARAYPVADVRMHLINLTIKIILFFFIKLSISYISIDDSKTVSLVKKIGSLSWFFFFYYWTAPSWQVMNHVWDPICRVIFDKVLCCGRAVMIIQHCPIELNTQQVVYGLCGSFFTLTKKKKNR